jgi:tRNA dimethylallyltransferase
LPDKDANRTRLIIILGPTAAGKSKTALELARRFDGEIISADSMQVYRHMDIGTAKPSSEERARVTHHLIDVVDPDGQFNAAMFLELAVKAIDDIRSRNRNVFVVGGTGLYIRVLTGGLIEGPGPSPGFRERLNSEMTLYGKAYLYEMLKDLDEEAAKRLHPNDSARIIRALETIELTGSSITAMQCQHGFRQRRYNYVKIGLNLPREELYRRIGERCREMMGQGFVEETRKLLEMGCGEGLKPMQALGYRHIVQHLKGLLGLEEALEKVRTDTRHYAKRQLTWFCRDSEIEWHRPQDEGIEARIREFLDD